MYAGRPLDAIKADILALPPSRETLLIDQRGKVRSSGLEWQGRITVPCSNTLCSVANMYDRFYAIRAEKFLDIALNTNESSRKGISVKVAQQLLTTSPCTSGKKSVRFSSDLPTIKPKLADMGDAVDLYLFIVNLPAGFHHDSAQAVAVYLDEHYKDYDQFMLLYHQYCNYLLLKNIPWLDTLFEAHNERFCPAKETVIKKNEEDFEKIVRECARCLINLRIKQAQSSDQARDFICETLDNHEYLTKFVRKWCKTEPESETEKALFQAVKTKLTEEVLSDAGRESFEDEYTYIKEGFKQAKESEKEQREKAKACLLKKFTDYLKARLKQDSSLRQSVFPTCMRDDACLDDLWQKAELELRVMGETAMREAARDIIARFMTSLSLEHTEV